MTCFEDLPCDETRALARHAVSGLTGKPKQISSSWLYDAEGSRLFQQIMELPEYYLSRAEHRILREQGLQISQCIASNAQVVDVIELGSGDGSKTMTLLKQLVKLPVRLTYRPFDISTHAIEELTSRFAQALPKLRIAAVAGDYFNEWPISSAGDRRVVFFLGSNIGNFDFTDSQLFLKRIRLFLRPGDGLLLGLDLQKDPAKVLAAYNDSQQVTAAFNLNLLRRLNREIGTNFALNQFQHYATYSPLDGVARSFIVSRMAQSVIAAPLNIEFEFDAGECIYVEQSRKYTMPMIDTLSEVGGFKREETFLDSQDQYAVVYLTVSQE